jgi:hypothetical protein
MIEILLFPSLHFFAINSSCINPKTTAPMEPTTIISASLCESFFGKCDGEYINFCECVPIIPTHVSPQCAWHLKFVGIVDGEYKCAYDEEFCYRIYGSCAGVFTEHCDCIIPTTTAP